MKFADVLEKYSLLGGRALTLQIVADEMPPTCDPLGRFNKLVFAPGAPFRHQRSFLWASVGGWQDPLDR